MNFRQRAAEVKAAGEETRGDFTPHGVPKRMYQWWLENSPSDKAQEIKNGTRRENFCHFWRVVVIWTPLLWALTKVLDGAEWVSERVTGTQAGIAFLVLLSGVVALIVTTTGTWIEFLQIVGFLLLVTVGAGLFVALLYFLDKKTKNGVEILFGTLAVIAVLIALCAGFLAVGFWLFAIIGGVAAFVFLAILLGVAAGKWVEAWRADRRTRANEAEELAWERYYDGDGPDPSARPVREPGRFSKFFSGIGDFLVLAAQVVRVNKWKICPLVEVEPVKRDEPEPFLF